ncbi:MAG: diguanylate cyclase domain-containing protein [Faecalibacillus sp.]|uniref:diguanylate cyclase domain-containing protein n=1 Tax=Faecalibacillus sp. TaxID=2678891 RepID=UPI003999C0BE
MFKKSGHVIGDEFIVFVKKIEDGTQAQKIRKIYIKDFKGSISCSMGIAFYPEHGTIFKTLYNLAGQTLYQTKDHGRNGYTCL